MSSTRPAAARRRGAQPGPGARGRLRDLRRRGVGGADRRDRAPRRRRRRHGLPALSRPRRTCSGRSSRTGSAASSTSGRALLASTGPGEALFVVPAVDGAAVGCDRPRSGRRARRLGDRHQRRGARMPRRRSSACSASCCGRRRRRAPCARDVDVAGRQGAPGRCARRCRATTADAAERRDRGRVSTACGAVAAERPCTHPGRVLEMKLALATSEC